MPDHSPATAPLASLAPDWRARAELLRRHGAVEASATAEELAGELEAALRAVSHEVLTLAQAARESGYSEDHLGRLVRAGKIPNAGRRHAPAVRRADLPRKGGALPAAAPGAISRAQIARAVADSYREGDHG